MAAEQRSRIRAVVQIVIGGQDVTARIDPHNLEVIVSLFYGGSDRCAIILDDRDASLRVPGQQEKIEILLGWKNKNIISVFEGYVYDVESGFARKGGGRTLTIEGWGHDQLGDIKTPQKMSMGEGEGGEEISFEKFFKKAAELAGVKNIRIHEQFKNIKRDFWHMNESFKNLGARLGKELGGVLSFQGENAAFVPLLGGYNAMGETMATVDATWGDNLLGWRIKPYVSPPQFKQSSAEHFNIGEGAWQIVEKMIGGEGVFSHAQATSHFPAPAPNAQVGEQMNSGMSDAVNLRRGEGFVLIDGEPVARPGGMVKISGARPGVDGTYLNYETEHRYSRGGFATHIQVRRPQGEPAGG